LASIIEYLLCKNDGYCKPKPSQANNIKLFEFQQDDCEMLKNPEIFVGISLFYQPYLFCYLTVSGNNIDYVFIFGALAPQKSLRWDIWPKYLDKLYQFQETIC